MVHYVLRIPSALIIYPIAIVQHPRTSFPLSPSLNLACVGAAASHSSVLRTNMFSFLLLLLSLCPLPLRLAGCLRAAFPLERTGWPAACPSVRPSVRPSVLWNWAESERANARGGHRPTVQTATADGGCGRTFDVRALTFGQTDGTTRLQLEDPRENIVMVELLFSHKNANNDSLVP